MKAFNDFILFKTDTLFNDKVQFKGIDGMQLSMDPTFEPAMHARIYGEVVSIPLRLSKNIPISQQHRGHPGYHEESTFSYQFISDIEQEVKVGDRIYYHFNTIKQKNIIKVEGVHPDRVWHLKVRYDQVIVAVRDGQIIPIGSHVLIDPDFESWSDISVPTYSNIMDSRGKPTVRPKNQWLVTKSKPGYKYLTGFVRHVGTPLRGMKNEIKEGQKIVYHKNADWKVHIEGRDFFCIKQRHILGRFQD